MSEHLVDGHGRRIDDLRVSVTDRCNFRCQYCMPADGLPWLDRSAVLTFEEIERLVRVFASMGVTDLRLTGGEPLVRREFPRLVGMLAGVEGVRDLSLTTNGYLLERDAEALVQAGIQRVNVSIDSLQRDRFFQMTRRDSLPQVLRGLDELAKHPEVHPIKVNAVAMRDFTEQEAIPFAEFARSTAFQVRFIEFMPLDADHAWSADQVLTGEELRAIIDAVHPIEELPREPSSTARVFRFADGRGEIGFINPVSEPFCSDCNRVRITAEGKLRTCLFSIHETDLREPLRSGASDGELEAIVRDAVWRKELKHHVGEPGFRQPPRTMSAIGGEVHRRHADRFAGLEGLLRRLGCCAERAGRARRRAPAHHRRQAREHDARARLRARAAGGRAPRAARPARPRGRGRPRRRLRGGVHGPRATAAGGAARRRVAVRRAAPRARYSVTSS